MTIFDLLYLNRYFNVKIKNTILKQTYQLDTDNLIETLFINRHSILQEIKTVGKVHWCLRALPLDPPLNIAKQNIIIRIYWSIPRTFLHLLHFFLLLPPPLLKSSRSPIWVANLIPCMPGIMKS